MKSDFYFYLENKTDAPQSRKKNALFAFLLSIFLALSLSHPAECAGSTKKKKKSKRSKNGNRMRAVAAPEPTEESLPPVIQEKKEESEKEPFIFEKEKKEESDSQPEKEAVAPSVPEEKISLEQMTRYFQKKFSEKEKALFLQKIEKEKSAPVAPRQESLPPADAKAALAPAAPPALSYAAKMGEEIALTKEKIAALNKNIESLQKTKNEMVEKIQKENEKKRLESNDDSPVGVFKNVFGSLKDKIIVSNEDTQAIDDQIKLLKEKLKTETNYVETLFKKIQFQK